MCWNHKDITLMYSERTEQLTVRTYSTQCAAPKLKTPGWMKRQTNFVCILPFRFWNRRKVEKCPKWTAEWEIIH